MTERKTWIDLLRGICMMVILYFHTECYSKNYLVPYDFYIPNALTIFYFLSGYLFYKETPFDIKHKVLSVLQYLVIPYFIFTSIIAIPKAVAHDQDVNIISLLLHILSGRASWFITSLVTAELLFSFILSATKQNHKIIAPIVLSLLLLCSCIPFQHETIIWNWHNALLAVFYLYAGYLYHIHEDRLSFLHRKTLIPVFFIVLVAFKIIESRYDISLLTYPLYTTSYTVYILDTLTGIVLMISVSKLLPQIKLIEWTGKHCIIYYFLCGGIPLTLSMVFLRLGWIHQHNYPMVVVLFLVVYFVTTCVVWAIYRYLPWMTGRKLRK